MSAFFRLAPALLLAALLLAGWEAYCRLAEVPALILPPPSGVLRALLTERESLGRHALSTVQVTALGFSLSIAFAFATSLAMHFVPWLQRGLMPLLVASQTIPLVALAPLMILWFGFGLLPKVLLVILVTFFPILLSLLSGYRAAEAAHLDLLASMGAGRWARFRRVRLPSARASFFTGLRISATYAIVATIFAEYAGARSGIGIFILTAKNSFRADLVLAGVVASALLTLGLLALIAAVQRLTARRFRTEVTHAGA